MGYVVGMDITANGALLWTDVGGAYFLDIPVGPVDTATLPAARQIITASSMPSGHVGPEHTGQDGTKSEFMGCFGGAIAPSNPSRIIFGFDGYLFGSDDKGLHNALINLPQQKMQSNSGASRLNNQKAAFHPTDPNTWIFGMADKVYYSTTGFAGTPSQMAGLAAVSPPGGDDSYSYYTGIDTTGKAFIAARGTGVYVAASVSSSPALTTGGPTTVCYMDVDLTTNKVWCCDESGVIWIYSAGSWTHPASMPAEFTGNPAAKVTAQGSHVMLFNANGLCAYSPDLCVTWYPVWPAQQRYISPRIPYLASTPAQIFPGGIKFRPGQAPELWASHGTGICYINPPGVGFLGLNDATYGIEEAVANRALWLPSGRIITAFWDKGFNERTEATIDNYMSALKPGDFTACWDVDGDDHLVVAFNAWAGVQRLQYSLNGGAWTDVTHQPVSAGQGGSIAVNGDEFIVAPSNDQSLPLLYTSVTAVPIALNFSGGRTSGDMGWGHAYYNNRTMVAADRTVAGKFFLYCSPTNDNVGRGFYRRLAGETALTFISYGPAWIQPMYRLRMRCVPGHTDHLFVTPGGGLANPEAMYRTQDGCATFTAVPNVTDAVDFDFTKPLTTYPSLEFYGRVSLGNFGHYVCDNILSVSPTYRLTENLPGGSFDAITCLTCSPNTYGDRIIGHSGTGFIKLF